MKKKTFFVFLLGVLFLVHHQGVNAQFFRHPGGLVSQDDIDRIAYLLDTEKDPTITAAFNKLKANGHAQFTVTATPTSTVSRGGTADNYSVAYHQAAAAFQNAFMWRITGDNRYADCSVNILNAWATTCKEIEGNSNASLAAGIYGYEFAQAGELLRGYSGWKAADFKVFRDWMRNMWAVRSLYFLDLRHGQTIANNNAIHYWSNWGLCNVMCVMSVGLLCDDVALYNEGLSHYKSDLAGNYTDVYSNPIQGLGYAEFLGNLVVWLQPDPRGPYGFLGQMQESGRDQGHATMALGLAVDICQTAWNQGEDLYGHMNNRLAAGIEYVALFNSLEPKTDPADSVAYAQEVRDSVPFLPYEREGWIMTENGGGMGATRPYWDRVVAHYEGEMGVKMTYSEKMRAKAGIDGGGGDYGPNSGGFDHLGFTTLTNYRPQSMYPTAGHFPVTLGASITYNGKTISGNDLSGVIKDSLITLSPTLPNGVPTNGIWKWETGGATTRELTFKVQKSGIYRVTYTSANGTKSRATFNIAVWGDCSPEKLYYGVTVVDTVYADTVVNVLPYQKFTLSINTRYNDRGTAVWNNGNTGFSLVVTNGVRKDSTFWVDHFNRGGYKTRVRFHVHLKFITPSVSLAGSPSDATSNVVVQAGQAVELIPITAVGFDGGIFQWSTGHKSKTLFVLNNQKGSSVTARYTLVKNNITYVDSIRFNISVVNHNYQLPNGDYYIRNTKDSSYLTNKNLNSTTKVAPTFETIGDALSRTWTITKETDAKASGRFKIVSKKDGNYLSENCTFGTNAYYPDWNTYTLHALDGENLFAVQNGGKAGALFWTINGNTVTGKGTTAQNGYPFLIMPVVPRPASPRLPGECVPSYIAPSYSIIGVPAKRGDTVSVQIGKSVTLNPVKVVGISGGSWLWGDNSTGSTLSLTNVQKDGVYPVTFTYPEGDSTYVFKLTYVLKALPATGINDVASSLATVYPNPVTNQLTVKVIDNTAQNSTFDLYTIDGMKLKSISCVSTENKVNTSDVPAGLYIGVLNENGKCQTFKITKK
ncbi:MAG TPA: alginate lyase family protein [Paludibacter sp.]